MSGPGSAIHSMRLRVATNEKLRYVVAGVWNTAVGLAIFALFWWALSATVNLWMITAVAHLLSTTNSFFVQRRFVFRSREASWLPQLARFQFAYVSVLAVVALFVNAMYVQGMHPLAGQTLAVAVIFVVGFFTGKHFTFSDVRFDLSAVFAAFMRNVRANLLSGGVFVASFAIFERVWAAPFYRSLTHVGHDFAYAALAALEGKYWIDSNGLIGGLFNPPWFTPAWCSGAAFFADPQASFYSPLQALSLVTDPVFAVYLGTLLWSSVAFWGSYVLARQIIGWHDLGATVFAVLGMANAFMPLRSAVGEPAYQPLYVWTILATALCWRGTGDGGGKVVGPSIAVSACLTAWLQFGFAGMMVPAFLATILFCLVIAVSGRSRVVTIAIRATLGGALAVVLNASKLYESTSLMRQFPRDFYGLPGFASFGDVLLSILYALIQPSSWTALFGLRALRNSQFSAFPHEWALNFGMGALTVTCTCAACLVLWRIRGVAVPRKPNQPHVWIAIAGIVAVFVIPLALLWDQSWLRDVIKQIPILNSTAWPMRWIVVYLPLTQWILAIPVVLVLGRLRRTVALLVCAIACVVVWLGPISEPTAYYLDPGFQGYDPKPVIRAFRDSQSSPPIPISSVDAAEAGRLGIDRNDTMLRGASQALCYNPIYGYRLEALPRKERLRSGGVFERNDDGQSLIFNPACLVQPEANSCKPGDGFNLDDARQLAMAKNFVARRPFDWQRTRLGRALSILSQAVFWLLLLTTIVRGWLVVVAAVTRDVRSRPDEKR